MVTYYNLVYFNTTGRAEIIRLLFTFITAAQDFTDTRINPPNWPQLKPSTVWGSMPYLEVGRDANKKVLGQTKAIIRYVAHEVGMGGHQAFEQGLVDSVVEVARDVWDGLYTAQYGDPAQKNNNIEKLKTKILPGNFANLEKFITKQGRNGFTVGSRLSTADLVIFDVVNQIQADRNVGLADAAAGYPRIKGVVDKVKANPKIAAYLAKRSPQQG